MSGPYSVQRGQGLSRWFVAARGHGSVAGSAKLSLTLERGFLRPDLWGKLEPDSQIRTRRLYRYLLTWLILAKDAHCLRRGNVDSGLLPGIQ